MTDPKPPTLGLGLELTKPDEDVVEGEVVEEESAKGGIVEPRDLVPLPTGCGYVIPHAAPDWSGAWRPPPLPRRDLARGRMAVAFPEHAQRPAHEEVQIMLTALLLHLGGGVTIDARQWAIAEQLAGNIEVVGQRGFGPNMIHMRVRR